MRRASFTAAFVLLLATLAVMTADRVDVDRQVSAEFELVSTVVVGDIGGGEPLPHEIAECQDMHAGEMIYDPHIDVWRCEG